MRTKLIVSGVLLILCLPLCMIGGYLFSYSIPREYYSKVTMEVYLGKYQFENLNGKESSPSPVEISARLNDSPNLNDPKVVSGIFENLRSKEVLDAVLDELNLARKWAASGDSLTSEQSHEKLLKMMELKQVRNTDLIQIGIYSRDPQEAAIIANAMAVQYRKKLADDYSKQLGLYLGKLSDEIKKMQLEMEETRSELIKIRERDHITDPEPENMDSSPAKSGGEYLNAKKKYLQEKKKLEESETRFETMKMETAMPFLGVKIWEKAEPAFVPARPNTLVILLISTAIGLLFAIPGVLLLCMGLCMQTPKVVMPEKMAGQ